MNLFVPKLSKERRQTKVFVPQLWKERRRSKVFVPQLSKEHRRSEVFVPQLSKERRQSKVFLPQLSKERRRSEVFVPQLSMICHCYSEELVHIHLLWQNPVFTFLHLRSPVHVIPPLDCTMRHITRLSNYRTIDIGLLFFSAIQLSEYGISDAECKKLPDYRISDLGLNLSDYRYRIWKKLLVAHL
jgi:hypothetical protein